MSVVALRDSSCRKSRFESESSESPGRSGRTGPGRIAGTAQDVTQSATASPRRAEQVNVSYGEIDRAAAEISKSESSAART